MRTSPTEAAVSVFSPPARSCARSVLKRCPRTVGGLLDGAGCTDGTEDVISAEEISDPEDGCVALPAPREGLPRCLKPASLASYWDSQKGQRYGDPFKGQSHGFDSPACLRETQPAARRSPYASAVAALLRAVSSDTESEAESELSNVDEEALNSLLRAAAGGSATASEFFSLLGSRRYGAEELELAAAVARQASSLTPQPALVGALP